MTDTPGRDCAELLAQADWVRALARQLTADAHAAEDLAQDALAAALARPALEGRPLRRWLAGALRNLVRQERRRAGHRGARERAAARGETELSTAELLLRLESHRAVVDAVARLGEPYQSAILLRYFEGLSPSAIARRTGTPVRTVHTRLHRALEHLRADLDRTRGGDRRAWLLALIPFARGSEGGSSAVLWNLLMEAKLKLGVAALAVAGICTTVVLQSHESAGLPPAAAPPGLAAAEPRIEEEGAGPESLPAAGERQALEPPAEQPASAPSLPPPARLTGHVIDVEHAPVGGIRVRFSARGDGARDAQEALTDAGGAFAIDRPEGGGTLDVATPGWTSLYRPEFDEAPGPHELVLVVARELTLAGRVVDERGAPVEAARVSVPLPFGLRSRFEAILDSSSTVERETITGPDGDFRLSGVPAAAGVELVTTRATFLADERPLSDHDEHALEIVLCKAPAGPERLIGSVVDLAGDPVEGAWVGLGGDSSRSGPDGAFALELGSEETTSASARILRAAKTGYLPAELELRRGAAWPERLVLELGPPPLSIAGRVVDARGEPLPGAEVWTDEETHFGYVALDGGEMSVTVGASLEGILRGDPWTFRTRADAAGRCELHGLLPRDYRVRALDREHLTLATAIAGAGARGLELGMPAEELRPLVAGRVTSLAGAPLAGVLVLLERPPLGGGPANLLESAGRRTDQAGHFEFEDVSGSISAVQVHGPEFGASGLRYPLAPGADLRHLEIAIPLLAYVQIDAGDSALADRASLLDAHGERLELTLQHGEHAYVMGEIDLEAGRSEAFSVSELATTLVLHAQGVEVRRVAVDLIAGELNTIRP